MAAVKGCPGGPENAAIAATAVATTRSVRHVAGQEVELDEVQREGQPHTLGGQGQQREPHRTDRAPSHSAAARRRRGRRGARAPGVHHAHHRPATAITAGACGRSSPPPVPPAGRAGRPPAVRAPGQGPGGGSPAFTIVQPTDRAGAGHLPKVTSRAAPSAREVPAQERAARPRAATIETPRESVGGDPHPPAVTRPRAKTCLSP